MDILACYHLAKKEDREKRQNRRGWYNIWATVFYSEILLPTSYSYMLLDEIFKLRLTLTENLSNFLAAWQIHIMTFILFLGDNVGSNSAHASTQGVWTQWGSYSKCSKSCGSGLQSRGRTCINPSKPSGHKRCPGPFRQSRPCNQNPCPGKDFRLISKKYTQTNKRT